jgi:hypothetical protein
MKNRLIITGDRFGDHIPHIAPRFEPLPSRLGSKKADLKRCAKGLHIRLNNVCVHCKKEF